ncbi:putative glutaredoxin, GIY-YIG endonuclease superfamily, Thioredoxin-like superfamily [Helianthus annuus]|uniref:GIY-YIG endonuclease superfamily, Thioredoxin-like superfamily n=1 Tax=Helianthus annuus TaxID=4232 RepID=A0A251TC86_HELAN|nr:bifunctional monothiol glutaredoxin-S16, chloroplastic [Helianthus annuus]KAF5759496.1 putative GIY-YIG endonuclease superfamily, Thioredoxin-like superfamily [Helianthus annuus]KAJ0437694.1 putative glutaredoxin, Thioredoxin-like superfamily [Helianthus annuus]KAJ0442192.1 putative glutaredoxin, GIY-YIG endonuclease superfamily, Thioredoxin-like superfamily [Helianthus annuus]KAJ0460013.1 putative glutaredoxin, Thioredoxin-like superfamily [Helianthus annuus]KAJ0640452.1 putative glutaredo
MAAMNLSSPSFTTTATSSFLSANRTKTLLSHSSYTKNPSIFSPIPLKITHTTKNPRPYLNLVVSAIGKLSESETVPVSSVFPSASGVYAVYDKNGDLQFVGLSRNIQASVLFHQKSVPELCASIKVGMVDNPDRTSLTEAWKSWMEEHIEVTGKVPPGNEKGNTTWVRQAPKKKSDLRITPGPNTKLTVPLEELIDRMVKENKVVAFIKGSRSAPQCGFSQRVVGILDSEGVDYESVDVLDEEHNSGLRETLKRYSNWPTFPQVFVNGELVGGCDILSSMHEKGELAGLFKQ